MRISPKLITSKYLHKTWLIKELLIEKTLQQWVGVQCILYHLTWSAILLVTRANAKRIESDAWNPCIQEQDFYIIDSFNKSIIHLNCNRQLLWHTK